MKKKNYTKKEIYHKMDKGFYRETVHIFTVQ